MTGPEKVLTDEEREKALAALFELDRIHEYEGIRSMPMIHTPTQSPQ